MMLKSRSYIAVPPGETIKEQLEFRGMKQKEFAERIGLSEKHVSALIHGDVQLTNDVAYRLEMVFGISATFWCNLESIYRENIIKATEENALDEEIKLAKKFPYKEMVKYGWIPDAATTYEKVVNLRKFFEVSKLFNLDSLNLFPNIAYRRNSVTDKADYALVAWAQKAKLDARNVSVSAIDIDGLELELNRIRSMTKDDPDEFCPELKSILASHGVALVFLPHIGGSFLHGATFVDNGKIVIGMTVRGKDADIFWFSLFHEIGHVVLRHIQKNNEISEQDERAADEFAKETLIPKRSFQDIVQKGTISKEVILKAADSLGIDAGIVVGRLQKEGYIKFSWHNDLKKKYALRTR